MKRKKRLKIIEEGLEKGELEGLKRNKKIKGIVWVGRKKYMTGQLVQKSPTQDTQSNNKLLK